MKKKILAVAVTLFASAMILAGNYSAQADDRHDSDNDHHDSDRRRHDHPPFFQFVPGTIVITRTVYKGTADTVTIGEACRPDANRPPPARASSRASLGIGHGQRAASAR